MGGNIFGTSLSGMNAAKYGLMTTQHNIANANTPGYTRQSVVLSSRSGQSTGAGFLGQGVNVTTVKRSYDQFLTGQVRQVQSQSSYLSTYLSSMKQVDNLLSNTTSGASVALQGFYDAMNGLANSPASLPARQTVLSKARSAVNSFKTMNQSLSDIANNVSKQIKGTVQTINTYATQIASLNSTIQNAIASSQGQPPNDLLDQRGQLINLLNKEVKTSVQQQSDGTMNVYIGSGQALVVGKQAMALQVVQNPNNPSKVDVAYLNNGKTTTLQQSSIQGGNLGAYLTFRNQSLEPARNALGRVALGLAASINQQNQMGQDLNGAAGKALLTVAVPQVNAGANNTGTATMTSAITNVSAVTTSDYQLKFDGANYSMTRLSDNQVTHLGSSLAQPRGVDGFVVTQAAGTMKAGDSFLIRPTVNAARDIALTTTDPTKIATALPFRGAGVIKATNLPTITTATIPTFSTSTVTGGTTATTANFTIDGITLATATVPGSTPAGTTPVNLLTPAQLNTAGKAFVAANLGYTFTGDFSAGTAQFTKAGGAAIILNETITPGAGATVSSLLGSTTPYTRTTPGSTASKISGITVATPAHANLKNPVAITFTSSTQYTVSGAVPAVAGTQTYNATNGISYNGWTMQISTVHSPVAGDVFNVAANSGSAQASSGTYNLNPVSINFTSATAYNVVEMKGVPPAPVTLATNVTYTAGSNISYNGWTTQIAGKPATGDSFNVSKGSQANAMLVTPAATNTTTASISGGSLSVKPFTILFNNPPTSYTVSGATPAVGVSIPYVTGQDISYNGWTMQISGAPVAGDVFNVAANTNGTGDNRNALMMAAQQNQNLMSNGTASLQGVYSQLVGSMGAKTQELTITSKSQNTMLTQTIASQQSVSGVNLDEEAANLMRYQRAYQAAAKAMQIANTMFTSLLQLGR
ncbi:MAG: flagellar hook-associated protein FlgK [Gallionella sp.]